VGKFVGSGILVFSRADCTLAGLKCCVSSGWQLEGTQHFKLKIFTIADIKTSFSGKEKSPAF